MRVTEEGGVRASGGGVGSGEPVAAGPGEAPADARRGMPAGAWVTSTYFAEGFPYSVVNNLAEILFKEMGASLQAIGLTSLFHLPWNLKFLWGPFLDSYESKRRWLVGTEVALSAVLLALAWIAHDRASLAALSVCFLLVAILSATHDMAIDGYYLEALVIFGTVTGRDPRSLGDGECSANELGFSRAEVKALQQVAFDQLGSAVTAAPAVTAVTAKPARAARCAARR